jgi:adenine-specific DNA-methyltransferase
MAAIDDLLQKVSDPVLRERLTKEIQKLKNKKGFGIVFEEHMPECTPLYEIPVTKGSRVAPRDKEIKETFTVVSVDGDTAHCISNIDKSPHDFCVKDIVVTAEIGEAIYPYLKEIDRICNAPENDTWHTLIEADNYHALQLLKYMYAGKVDCIYIDPPYNTGAKDWKYNNRFVDSSDAYPHSKWLSFMKRRLALAKELLNPDDSVLIVTIDEKEYLRLGMLLEDMFRDARIQMISSVINAHGVPRKGDFTRTNEFIYYVRIGNAQILPIYRSDNAKQYDKEVRWLMFRRTNSKNIRNKTKTQFYPIYVNTKTHHIERIGDAIPPNISINTIPAIEGCTTVWPIRDDGTEMMWGVTADECRRRLALGYIKSGSYSKQKKQPFAIQYLPSGTIEDIEQGVANIKGYRDDGSIIASYTGGKTIAPNTQWNEASHDAMLYGTNINNALIPNCLFPFPKSLYAVEDCIRFFVANKPDALILDFFAGSGTTAHATMLLNHLDGGHRRCISVTNNEISAEEEKKFVKQGLRHGDPEWEAHGIARYVTWPRIKAAVTGINTLGEPIKGSYKFNEEFPMSDGFAENAVYFKLGFLDRNAVALGRQFKELLPILWMKAGCVGPCPQTYEDEEIPDMMILPQNKMAVLIDETSFASFAKEMENHPEIETVYIITDSERGYREMIHTLGVKNTYRLYRDYLENFRINLKG